jgi:hypothetical protein
MSMRGGEDLDLRECLVAPSMIADLAVHLPCVLRHAAQRSPWPVADPTIRSATDRRR